MPYTLELVEEKKNPLIDRLEVKYRVDYFGESTPNKLDLKQKIAAKMGGKIDMTIIKKVRTYFGAASAIVTAYIYTDQKELEYYEPFHIRVRNLSKDKRVEIYKLKKKKEPYKHLFNEQEQEQEQKQKE